MSFTSDLSMDEATLLDAAGFEPVDLVTGSCYYHIGYTWGSWGENHEMVALTHAMYEARRIAMFRLFERTVNCQADGVVGVRIEIEHHGHHANFLVAGTAVRRKNAAEGPAWRNHGGTEPFTCDLSGQDFFQLARAGYKPCRIVMGNCVYHVAHQTLGQYLGRTGQNYELENFTAALYDARELAMERMQADALAAGGRGVVGVKVHEGNYGWQSHVLEFLALGTAVAEMNTGVEHDGVRPAVSLNEVG